MVYFHDQKSFVLNNITFLRWLSTVREAELKYIFILKSGQKTVISSIFKYKSEISAAQTFWNQIARHHSIRKVICDLSVSAIHISVNKYFELFCVKIVGFWWFADQQEWSFFLNVEILTFFFHFYKLKKQKYYFGSILHPPPRKKN